MSDTPPPGSDNQPWFHYEISGGSITARPVSREGKIACLISVLLPFAIIGAVFVFARHDALIMVGGIFAAVGGSLISLFALIFAKGRRM